MAQEILTPYQILGVTEDANVETIKRAFRQRSKECHPDVCQDAEAARKFRELSEARDLIITGKWHTAVASDIEAMIRRSRDSVFWR